jgi:hypothetical protein
MPLTMGGRWRRNDENPDPIAAAAASAHVRRPEGITAAGYLDQLAERLTTSIGLPVATARARVERVAISAAARPGPEHAA